MQEQQEQKKREIKIVDKRRFSSDGHVRPEAAHIADASKESYQVNQALQTQGSDVVLSSSAGDQQEAASVKSGGAQDSTASSRSAVSKQPAMKQEPELTSFINFVAQLATTVLAALGALPENRGIPVNYALARDYIDILAMLQEKTKGNLSENEALTLQQLLTELRMQYVEIVEGVNTMPDLSPKIQASAIEQQIAAQNTQKKFW